MKISVFGLGYVGAVSAACLAAEGHDVIGVDVSLTKIELINEGKSPIIEEGIAEMTSLVVSEKRLRATSSVNDAINNTDISLVCVGTPSNFNGSLKLDYVERVSRQIGEALAKKADKHTVVMRSTMLPGTIESLVRPALEESSGKKEGVDFDLCVNPEFLREGSSIKDFYKPPFTLIGADSSSAAETLGELYAKIDAPIFAISVKAAEMVKYACNCFHGLKVAFANEIGNICKESGIDSHEVMDVFVQDTKLNLSPYYLKPGFAFGGSCLPKDLRALSYRARQLDVPVPLLEATLESNLLQIERAVALITKTGKKKIGFLGFAFKAGTDDLRESPIVAVIERMIGKGFDVCLYDKEVSIARLVGANKEYIEQEIPHIARVMAASIEEVIESSDVIVIGNNDVAFESFADERKDGKIVIDLVRVNKNRISKGSYSGICW
jgi:GDP-mannose 6-dehydrogenase